MEKVREYTLSTVVNHSYITFYIYGLIISLFHIKVTTRSNKPPLLQFRLLSYCIALFSHRHNKITNITSYNDFNVQLVIFFFWIYFLDKNMYTSYQNCIIPDKKRDMQWGPIHEKGLWPYSPSHEDYTDKCRMWCKTIQNKKLLFLQLEVCSFHHKTPYETYITVSISC